MWAMDVGKNLGVRKRLTSLKKPFHFFQGLIFLPISTVRRCQGSYDGVSTYHFGLPRV